MEKRARYRGQEWVILRTGIRDTKVSNVVVRNVTYRIQYSGQECDIQDTVIRPGMWHTGYIRYSYMQYIHISPRGGTQVGILVHIYHPGVGGPRGQSEGGPRSGPVILFYAVGRFILELYLNTQGGWGESDRLGRHRWNSRSKQIRSSSPPPWNGLHRGEGWGVA